jgi:murein L,D-transpeptidase YafK
MRKIKMKRYFIIIFLGWFLNSGGTGCLRAQIRESPRSRAAIQQVRPGLESELTRAGFNWGAPIYLRIFKSESVLEVWIRNQATWQLFKSYRICYYSGKLGPKLKRGDEQSPEGFYQVYPRQLNPNSTFHLAFDIGYPNRFDRFHGRTGSAIMVHGNCVSIGCYAMTDPQIEEIYALADAALRQGQAYFQIDIFPFRLTPENLNRQQTSAWIDFWRNLKIGYDYFEKYHLPPRMRLQNGQYQLRPVD